MAGSWEDELREHFPGYLLPASALESLSRAAASRFLERITKRPDALTLLLAVSALAPRADDVRELARQLPLIAQMLPSTTEIERTEADGMLRGRMDVPGTLRSRLAGNPGRVVSRIRRRRFDLPENILLSSTAQRIAALLVELDAAGTIPAKSKRGWAADFRAAAQRIWQTMASTPLRQVPIVPITHLHEEAARAAAHPAYKVALRLQDAMKEIDTADRDKIARVVADGALTPLDAPTRFEIAVLIRLGRSIEQVLAARGASFERTLIHADRDHVFEFLIGPDRLLIHYNQPVFEKLGPRDLGMRRYFGQTGRLRPDITVEHYRDGQRVRGAVVEVKCSDEQKTMTEGFEQALLYGLEYAEHLTRWPKAMLVVSSETAILGTPRMEDDVIAIAWKDWVPLTVLEHLLDGVGSERERRS